MVRTLACAQMYDADVHASGIVAEPLSHADAQLSGSALQPPLAAPAPCTPHLASPVLARLQKNIHTCDTKIFFLSAGYYKEPLMDSRKWENLWWGGAYVDCFVRHVKDSSDISATHPSPMKAAATWENIDAASPSGGQTGRQAA